MTTLHLLLVAAVCFCVNAQTISPTNLEGQVGQNVVFECTSFLVNDTDSTLVEFRTASEMVFSVLDDRDNPRLNRSDSGSTTTYTYGPLTPEDNNAVFRCQSSSQPTAGATISVVFAAMISAVIPSNQSFTFRENNQQALVIDITVDGNPAPTYTWTRDGLAVQNSSTITVTRTSFRAYAVRENRGDYVVTYQNTVGNDMHSFSLDILFQSTFPAMAGQGVNCTPVGQDFVCSTQPGTTVMLNCNAVANPPANVTFSPQEVNTVGNTIVISNFTEAANYSCTATNEGFDPVTRNFRVVVGGLPVSVSGPVTVTFDESAETVTFSWTYDNTMNIIPATSFNVTITPELGTTITRTVNINDLSLTLSFSDLMSETGYTVSVVAVNQLGGSVAIGNTFESPETSNARIAVASYMLSVLMIAVLALFF